MDNRMTADGGGRRHRRREMWMFCKAQVSAWLASAVDFLVTIVLAKFCGLFYLYATFIGSVAGGITNCVVNYGWVFHAGECRKAWVAVKYLFVWGMSILLNTGGTFLLTEWLTGMDRTERLPDSLADNLFIFAKGLVAVTVALVWNYGMQRTFVYRNLHLRRLFAKGKQPPQDLEHD